MGSIKPYVMAFPFLTCTRVTSLEAKADDFSLRKRHDAILRQGILIDEEPIILQVVEYLLWRFMACHDGHHVERVHGPDAARFAPPSPRVVPHLGGGHGGGDAPRGGHTAHARHVWGLV